MYNAHLSFVETADGSKTIYNEKVGENYHSKHGALQESKHVFLKSGLEFFIHRKNANSISILEVGFGTGLNFLLSADYCNLHEIKLDYTGIEGYPISVELIKNTGYDAYVSGSIFNLFLSKYESALTHTVDLGEYTNLRIANSLLEDFETEKRFDVIYFDAFAAIHQPEMWSEDAISHCCNFLKPGGVFVTYAITGNLKRTMKSLNFSIEKAPGAPGKREMLRAVKN
jgi:tRNA U34 5-methylaminomethyl-2-thiouridine-forming methyltransferase MnmC